MAFRVFVLIAISFFQGLGSDFATGDGASKCFAFCILNYVASFDAAKLWIALVMNYPHLLDYFEWWSIFFEEKERRIKINIEKRSLVV